jgi:AraC-like DNA-binding protein
LSEDEIRLLKEKLQNHDRRIAALEDILKDKKETHPTENSSKILKLASELGISINKFDELFDIDGTQLTTIKHTGEDDKTRIQTITLLTLFGYKIYFGLEEVLSQEIRRNVAENGISLNNFNKFLNELIPSLIRRKGKLKSPTTSYRLSIPGEVKAKELIRAAVGSI